LTPIFKENFSQRRKGAKKRKNGEDKIKYSNGELIRRKTTKETKITKEMAG